MREFFNYGLSKDVQSKLKDGMFRGGDQYTTVAYYDPQRAGRELGVAEHNIEVVLKFIDDHQFKSGGLVQSNPNRGFIGGVPQFSHPGRPKPVAMRKIGERDWTPL